MLVGKEHVALITGGSGGLGAATAKRLLDMGGRVGVLDRDEDGLAALVASTGAADRLHVFPCDVSNEESVAAGVESCVRTFGCIHAAVQCAGIVSYSQTLEQMADEKVAGVRRAQRDLLLAVDGGALHPVLIDDRPSNIRAAGQHGIDAVLASCQPGDSDGAIVRRLAGLELGLEAPDAPQPASSSNDL